MLKLLFSTFAIAVCLSTPALADHPWYMVRTLAEHVSVIGTYPDEATCSKYLDALTKFYAPGSVAKVAGKPFGERSCRDRWPD